jgi:chromate transporter
VSAADLLEMFLRFALLSLLSIGGAITVAPEMHRFVVAERGWIGDGQFAASISLAQAAPGPNLLFVTLVGWNAAGWIGAAVATAGIMLPSSVLALAAHRWTERLRERPWIQAFRAGMAPITIGLLLATGWILGETNRDHPVLVAVTAASAAIVMATKINPLWLIAGGALAGIALTR